MVQQNESVDNYIDLIIEKLQSLTTYLYTAKTQSRYSKEIKESLNNETVVFLGDFAENYKFVVQDEVQSFHLSNLQATLYPVVIYYKEENKLKHTSYCVKL